MITSCQGGFNQILDRPADIMDVEADQAEESKILAEDDAGEEDEAEEGEKESAMERYCGIGRVWIFLALGVLTLVLCAVLAGVHMNVRVVTSSLEQVEVIPFFLPAATGSVAGVLVLLLFWRRLKALVYGAVTTCVAAASLCVVAAVLTGTHVLQPLLSVSGCVYHQAERACRCLTQFRRAGIGLEEVHQGDHVFLTMEGTLGCDDVYTVIPGLMYAMVGVYGVITLVCLVAGVIALLVYRTEKRRKYMQNLAYDDQFMTRSGQLLSDNHAMLPLHPGLSSSDPKLLNTYINSGNTTNDEETSTTNNSNTTPSDLIYSPSDVPMGYTEACQMRRCQSFSQPRRGSIRESSPGSTASSQTASLPGVTKPSESTSKLKVHRRKGRRAVTLHGLDREQLLLILSLQMRYLQESNQSTNGNPLNISKHDGIVCSGPSQDNTDSSSLFALLQRRALTPTPRQERLTSNRSTDDDLDYRPAKLVRSHTPQPFHFRPTHEHNLILLNSRQPQQYPQPQQLQQHPQQLPHDNDDQHTMITFDLRNIKTGSVVHGPNSSARSSLSGSSCSSHNSSLSCSGGGHKHFKLIPASSHPLDHVAAEAALPDRVKEINVHAARGQPSTKLTHNVSLMSTSSQSDCDCSLLDTNKLISSEQEPARKKSMKVSQNEDIRVVSESTELSRPDSSTSKTYAGSDRWQTLMEDGSRQAQTLWENVQRRAPSEPHIHDSNKNPLMLQRHQSETAPLETEYCESPYSIRTHYKDSSSTVVMSSEFPHSAAPAQINLTGQLDSFNVFSKLPETRIIPAHLPVSLHRSHDLHHKIQTTAPKRECYSPHQNAFIPIDSSFTDNSEDADQTDCSSHHPGSANHIRSSEDTVPSRRNDQLTDKIDHCPSRARPRSDRPQSRTTNCTEVVSATHLNDPSSRSSKTFGQCVEPEHCVMTDTEIQGSSRGTERIEGSFRGPNRMEGSFRGAEIMEGSFRDTDRMGGSSRGTERRHVDDRRRIIDTYIEENRRGTVDRHTEDDRRRASDRHLESDIQYQTTNDIYGHDHRQPRRTTKPRSDHGVQHVYHNPYAVQSGRHAYNSTTHRPQHSAFYTLGHGPKMGPTSHHNHRVQEEACDTDLDSLPVSQWKGQYVRGQSLPPPSLHHSLESVARPAPARSGFTTSPEAQGTPYTSSELLVPHSRRDNLDSRSRGNGWNPNTSRYPLYHGPSTDHRYHNKQQWHPRVSRGLSREQLYTDNKSDRQPHMNIRRCQSVDEGHRYTQPHLYTGSYRSGQQDNRGGFYQNKNALRTEMKVGHSVNMGAHSRHPVFQSYPTSEGNFRAMFSKNFPTNDIAGYVGVAKLVESSDSDDFVETVI